MGIQCNFPNKNLLFVLGVYLPSSNAKLEEFQEYFDHLWALYDSLSARGYVLILGDLNGDLGNSLGDKGSYEPNQRGLKLLDLVDFFNLCPVNLLGSCSGPLESYISHCGRYRSTVDYILLPNCLLHNIVSAKTFDPHVDNTSDHLPIEVCLSYPDKSVDNATENNIDISESKPKVRWYKFSSDEVNEKYSIPLLRDLQHLFLDSFDTTENAVTECHNLLQVHSFALVSKPTPKRKNKNKNTVYVKLPSDVQAARHGCKGAFNLWKQQNFSDNDDVYRTKRREYRKHLRKFLNQIEIDKAAKLCNAAQSNEKLFWKLIKNQKSSSQMSAFLIDGKMITDKNDIREMWAEHFEKLGTPSTNTNFDSVFLDRVSASVQEFMTSCKNDSFGDLNDPLRYEEVANVCSKLKPGVSGVVIDYEHVRFAGPVLWNFLFELYNEFFDRSSICESLKVGTILPLFKGKGVKANYKDNYRGITLFPTLCKIYEMVLLNRLEKYAERRGFFSNMQFGFQEGVGCIEASFIILETINHMLERGSKIFSCFLDLRKAFETVWIDGLLFKLFTELGINGRMWLAIKDLYTNVKARVLYSGSLSRMFDISQGTGQGRILAPFMYKVYINSLLNVLSNHCYAIFISGLRLSRPSFADDISLITQHASFLQSLMTKCVRYSLQWRYEFNHTKSGVVTFGESKPSHLAAMQNRNWVLGDDNVDELYEYKNLGILKNYVGSFSSNIDDNIEKTQKKAGMIFSPGGALQLHLYGVCGHRIGKLTHPQTKPGQKTDPFSDYLQ